MENNVGVANIMISKKLKDIYFNDNSITESQDITSGFIDVLKNSKILQLEYKVYNNIENKHIDSDLSATKYIDNNIKLFETFTLPELYAEHEKLNEFIYGSVDTDTNKYKLYESINNLVIESLSTYENVDVDLIHESFTYVLNHIKQPKNIILESTVEPINEEIIEIAINKFNETYDDINESDKNLLKVLITATDKEKQELHESMITETLDMLNKINDTTIGNKMELAIKKINEMKYTPETVTDNIIDLHELMNWNKNIL